MKITILSKLWEETSPFSALFRAACRALVKEHFGVSPMVDQYEKVYEALIANKKTDS